MRIASLGIALTHLIFGDMYDQNKIYFFIDFFFNQYFPEKCSYTQNVWGHNTLEKTDFLILHH